MIPWAMEAEQQALRVDPSLPEANALLAVCIGCYEYDWPAAERHWRLAMAREPVSRDVLFWYGNHYLAPVGRAIEAVDAMERGLERDPLNLIYRVLYARGLRLASRASDAEAELRVSWKSIRTTRLHWLCLACSALRKADSKRPFP